VFKIPQTHNVLAGLFDPRLPKSSLDVVTLATLGSQVLLWLYLPLGVSKYLFMALFAFWRLAYNAGLGWLLTQQSKRRLIVNTVKRNAWLDENKHPLIKKWIKTQVSIKMGKDYDFDAMPVEWNTWVLFRHSVDIILLNDFLSYFFCGISFLTFPESSDSKAVFMCVLRWVAGITLLVFNLWVKTDAHRIITDLAWYWADTFFSSSQDLVFDGVFEMAPHPMYSVGYAGYYGLSLIAGSEAVLYVSLAAHACQFAFLVFFEEPHIERTYGERKPIAMRTPLPSTNNVRLYQTDSPVVEDTQELSPLDASSSVAGAGDHTTNRRASVASSASSADLDAEDEARAPSSYVSTAGSSFGLGHGTDKPHLRSKHDFDAWYFRQDTIIFQNFDPLRATDFAFGLAVIYLLAAFVMPYLSPKQQLVAVFVNALVWRLGHTFGLGSILKAQSERKWLVRHYLKHYHYEGTGFGAVEEAFSNWKSIYNMSHCVPVTGSFVLLALKCYDWALTEEKLRHTLGLLLIALHMWTSKGIYEVLGRFGWFYGDFFIASEGAPPQLIYTGIYRHVNNPERIMGGAAFFGLAIISGSKLVGILAIISVLSHFWFLSRVENPHMRRLYGDSLRQDAGVTKTFKGVASKNAHRAPPKVAKAVQEFQGTLERVYDDTAVALEEFLKRSAPRLNNYVENTKVLLRESGERLLITRVANVASLDRSAYSLKIERPEDTNAEQHLPDLPRKSPQYKLGEAIRVDWTAPSNCSRRDWIGLYRHGANKSKLVTRIRSKGRWLGIYPDEWDGNDSLSPEGTSTSQGAKGPKKSGSLLFTGHRLFWKTGQYEFRYHHDGKHNVMAVSEPFEITVDRPVNPDNYASVYSTLLPLVTRCLDSDPQLVPETAWPLLKEQPDESTKAEIHAKRTDEHDFVLYTNEQAERIASAVKQSCGIELTSDVIVAEANLAKLTRSVVESAKLLKPFEKAAEKT
ncbi:hypothetical protein P389DRAFT_205768, partial [Cystobasidium minutum MCA 4210]|uniref:uncharacterized protein n=1 Tax=Cystobasidium minutum MCA 4210 TaxID=1397322 RepID=UPI0034CFC3B6